MQCENHAIHLFHVYKNHRNESHSKGLLGSIGIRNVHLGEMFKQIAGFLELIAHSVVSYCNLRAQIHFTKRQIRITGDHAAVKDRGVLRAQLLQLLIEFFGDSHVYPGWVSLTMSYRLISCIS